MRSEDVEFVGGPLDGRVLPVPVGPLGNPPRRYDVPVPPDGDEPGYTLHYRRAADPRARRSRRLWRYEFQPETTDPAGK
ncbi:hypothetical protein [Allostreptomyces psammosilenae]|uniref:Uncharacterized protein n=1 Tax=Allostreptomyces psammosilenae TaxID=1892865 RepID=A0A853A6C5_9ACTN|nr:hypothetical protein [Allostreptomyces psammosilenae]NYI08394.1 hypothetical protein [Allostreptomyces psammosilenae]